MPAVFVDAPPSTAAPAGRSELDISRAKRRARRMACSDAWTEEIVYRGVSYPPGGKATAMRACRCTSCQGKRLWPPYLFNERVGMCSECTAEGWPEEFLDALPSSCSVISEQRARDAARTGRTYFGGLW